MTFFRRKAYETLVSWRDRSSRKPLLLRGARQVGKTTLVKMFSREFSTFLCMNLEVETDREIFERINTAKEALDAIYLSKNVIPGKGLTLLFIDEIQECPKAIQMLRYFYEQIPELYVIAAGSLLEFSLSEIPSFPVGRVEYLCLHPMDFEEFLKALNHDGAVQQLRQIPVAEYAHPTLLKLFHIYAITGGMPEVIQKYSEENQLASALPVYEQLWQSFKDDVEKYARNRTERNVIRHIIDTAAKEEDRVKFERFGNSNYRSREVGEAMRALEMARIIQLVYPTTSLAPPTRPDLKKRPRLQMLDTGLLNHASGVQAEMIGLKDLSDFYRGKIIQHLVTQELIAIHGNPSYRPHFWVREKPNSNAEVDLVYQHKKYLVPIEIKSGHEGRLRSLHQFIERCDHTYGIRMCANKLSVERSITSGGKEYWLLNLPYYLAGKIPDYIEWFVGSHP